MCLLGVDLRELTGHRSVCANVNVYTFVHGTVSFVGDTLWRSWLSHCAANRKVAVSIPGGVIGIFH